MAKTKKVTVSADEWTPDSVDEDGNPVFPPGVDRIEMITDKRCLVVIGDDTFVVNHYNQVAAVLAER